MQQKKGFVRKAADVAPVACPCGQARRIVTADDNDRVSIHRVTIAGEAAKHYHEIAAEHYYILSGAGEIELDDETIAVQPGDLVYIPPGVRHALRGDFEIINVVAPPFDPADEYVVE